APQPGDARRRRIVSETKPNAAAAPKAAGNPGAVIRILEASKETFDERLMRKHLPAWVISGAVNIGTIALVMLIFGGRDSSAKPPGMVVATSVEKEEEQPEKELTNEDRGLQTDLQASLPELNRIAEQTVDSAVTEDHLGQPDAPTNDAVALLLPGLNSP